MDLSGQYNKSAYFSPWSVVTWVCKASRGYATGTFTVRIQVPNDTPTPPEHVSNPAMASILLERGTVPSGQWIGGGRWGKTRGQRTMCNGRPVWTGTRPRCVAYNTTQHHFPWVCRILLRRGRLWFPRSTPPVHLTTPDSVAYLAAGVGLVYRCTRHQHLACGWYATRRYTKTRISPRRKHHYTEYASYADDHSPNLTTEEWRLALSGVACRLPKATTPPALAHSGT